MFSLVFKIFFITIYYTALDFDVFFFQHPRQKIYINRKLIVGFLSFNLYFYGTFMNHHFMAILAFKTTSLYINKDVLFSGR